MVTDIHEVGTVKIGDESYRLVRTKENIQAWSIESADEPPWENGLPPMLSEVEETWHLGGFKSREGIEGTTEYGDTDDRWPLQMLPGPYVTPLLGTSSAPLGAFYYKYFPNPPTWVDDTAEAGTPGGTPFTLLKTNNQDFFYIGCTTKFDMLTFNIVTPCEVSLPLDWEYSTGPSAWTDITAEYDTTHGFYNSGSVVWESGVQTGWVQSVVQGVTAYWVRVSTITAPYIGPTADFIAITAFDASFLGTPTHIFECLGYIFVLKGRYVYRINPSTLETILSKDFGAGVNTIDGLRWETDIGLVTTDATTNSLWKVTAIVGGGPDTWTQTTTVAAYRLATGIDRLYKISKAGVLRNLSTGLDPMTETNWADTIQCGFTDTLPTSLVAFEDSVLVGKPEGLYGVSAEEGTGVPLISRMVRNTNNCLGMKVIEPYVFVPHSRGVYRHIPGVSTESVGLEKEVLNQIAGGQFVHKGFAVDNQWIYSLVQTATFGSWMTISRDARSGESTVGPMVWDTLINLGNITLYPCIHISTLTTPPTLWFPYSSAIGMGYIKLPASGGPPDSTSTFALSAIRYSPRYNFGDWNSKDFPKIEVACKGVSTSRYWNLAYSIDGGAWVTMDSFGVPMAVTSEGVKTFYFASTAVGKEIQYRYSYTGPAADTAPAPLVYFRRFAIPQSRKLPVVRAQLHLAEGQRHDRGIDPRTAIQQFSDLLVLSEQAASVVASGPWGENEAVWIRKIEPLEAFVQEGSTEPELIAAVYIQKRETS